MRDIISLPLDNIVFLNTFAEDEEKEEEAKKGNLKKN